MQAYNGRPGLPRAGVRKLPAVWSERGEDADFWQKSGKCMDVASLLLLLSKKNLTK